MDEQSSNDEPDEWWLSDQVEYVPITITPRPAQHLPALPARLQSISRDRWDSINAIGREGMADKVAAQLRVRCGMKDCPGDLGRISLTISGGPLNGRSEHLVFELARGLSEREDGAWALGPRAQAFRKHGLPPRWRRPHKRVRDWDGSRPLRAYDMAGTSIALYPKGGATEIECPVCHRLVRLYSQVADAALAEVRRRG